jgi:hypothetical protein
LAFGYQCALIFLTFSLDHIIQLLQSLLSLPGTQLENSDRLLYGVIGLFIVLVSLVFFVPVIMISRAYLKLRCSKSWLKKRWSAYLFSLLISLGITHIYINAISFFSSFKDKAAAENKVDGYYLQPFELRYKSNMNILTMFVPFALENPLKNSVVIEAESNAFYLAVGVGDNKFDEVWEFLDVGYKKHATDDIAKWIAVDPGKTTVIGGEFSLSMKKVQLCSLITRLRNAEKNTDTNIYVNYDISFRARVEDVQLDRVLPLDQLVFLYDGIKTDILGNGIEKYNKANPLGSQKAPLVPRSAFCFR